jgi:hypothetical protein
MRIFVAFGALALGFLSLECASSHDGGTGWQGAGPAGGSDSGQVGPDDGGSPDGDDGSTIHAPGTLVITSPSRAAFISSVSYPSVKVTGTGASPALTIDGRAAQVQADGSFSATVTPSVGLNLIHAIDGSSSLDVPFLYGTFASPIVGVAQAVALRINPPGIDNGDPNGVTLAGLVDRGLATQDLLASIQGQTYGGSLPANGSWTFAVTGAHYAGATVQLAAQPGGVSLVGTLRSLEVDGNLTINIFGQTPSGPVSLTADSIVVNASLNVSLNGAHGVQVDLASPQTTVNNFQYHSNNAGFPCCVDGIMTGVLKPTVTQTVQTGVQQNIPPALTFALSSFGLPSSFDLTPAGLPAMIGLGDTFDGVTFDASGGTLSANVLVSAPLGGSGPGGTAPGWLRLAKPLGNLPGSSPFALALSFDLANQALFNVWGQGGFAKTITNVPIVGTLQEAPSLPPVLLPNAMGGVTAALGEVVVHGSLSGQPVTAGVSIVADVDLSVQASPSALVLTIKGTPQVSLTWLSANGIPDNVKQTVASSAASSLAALIPPVQIPLPAIPLDALSPSLAGETAAFAQGASVALDAPANRANLLGNLVITP